MTMDMSYDGLMARKNEIMKKSVGIDYTRFEKENISFDYEEMMAQAGYSLSEVAEIQKKSNVGSTPLLELI